VDRSAATARASKSAMVELKLIAAASAKKQQRKSISETGDPDRQQ